MSQITNITRFLTIGLLILNQNGVLVLGQVSESLFGFDVRNPIIYQNVQSENYRSHFGWSVTLVETGYSRSGKNHWIFIGDPLGKSTDPTYSRVKEPGVVWRCSIGLSASGTTPECYIANLDPIDGTCTQNYNGCKGIKPAFEYHNENWVGGTLASSSNRIVTCAHRWHRGEIPVGRPPKEQVPLVNGLCYFFNKDTMYSNWAQSQSTVNISLSNYGNHRLIPFFGNEPMDGQYWSGSNGLSNPDLAFAEAGFSIHLSLLAEGQNEVIIGAPGTRLFAGSVTRYKDGRVLTQGSSRLNADNRNEFSRFSTVRLPETYTDYFNAYFGYAVTSGQYFNKGETWYVGGSPRANRLQGQVVLFQFPQSGINRIVDYAEKTIAYQSIIPQFGAYFGSVLASANVDADNLGLDELFVGAPFQNTDNSGQSDGNQGAVFVFYKLSNRNNLAAITLTGSNYAGSRFGSAIASIGDINEDGFNDIAVGAPFEGPDSGGAVYIFYGKDNIVNDWKFGLRISSTDYPDPIYLRGFGCSFSNAIDIDNNGTPDLAIGSFLSKSVAIFRTRPMLKLTAYLKFYDQRTQKSIFRVESNVQTFNVEVCVILSGNNSIEIPDLEVENTVKMDERYKRFKFTTPQGPNHQLIYKSSTPPGSEHCTLFEAKITSQDREIGDIANIPPITFEQFVEYKGAPVKVSPIRMYEVAGNGRVTSAQTGPDQFCPSCPFPTSGSNFQELPITSDCKDITRCKPELEIKAWFEDVENHKNITKVELDWNRKITLWIYVKNDGEPAFSPEVSVNFNSQLQQPPDFLFGSSDCKFEVGLRDKFICSLGKLIKRNQEQVIGIPFTLKNIYADKADATYYVHLNVGSRTDDPRSRIVFDLTLQVIFDSKVTLIGSVTSPKDEVQVGSLFHQDYRVILQGHSPVALLTFNFKFPVTSDYAPGTELLIGEPQGKVYCRSGPFTDFSKLDPGDDSSIPVPNPDLDDTSVSQSRRRRRRQIEENPELAQPERIEPNENMTHWICTESGITCVDVHCELRNFKSGVEVISFQMKLNHITSKDEPKEKSLLLLESFGEVHLFGEGSGSQKHDSANGFSQTLIRLEIALIVVRPAIWIYIVSGIGGIILLSLIMICLYKAGFFKRSTKQQLEELKAQTEIQQSIQAASRRASEMGPGEQETALN